MKTSVTKATSHVLDYERTGRVVAALWGGPQTVQLVKADGSMAGYFFGGGSTPLCRGNQLCRVVLGFWLQARLREGSLVDLFSAGSCFLGRSISISISGSCI
jgi:hypothetical protein